MPAMSSTIQPAFAPMFASRALAAIALAVACAGSGCADLGGATDDADTDATTVPGSAGNGTSPDTDADDTADSEPATSTAADDSDTGPEPTFPDAQDGIEMNYRDDLDAHPGCTTANLSYTAAQIDGYRCAAKEYTSDEDTDKPIVLLIHGNSDDPGTWESFHPMGACEETRGDEGAQMLAELLPAGGYKTIAVDMRYDLVDDPGTNNDTENAAKNMDHGWGVPILQHFLRSVIEANPGRRFVIVAHSFGVTATRDALRRLLVNDGYNAFEHLDQVFYMAGANHGVSSYPLCGVNPTMRGSVTCEMGDRAAYSPTYFLRPINGPQGAFEAPCVDGTSAYGEAVCGEAVTAHTTVVMQDLDNGEQQDLFVSESSSALKGADNRTIGLNDFDKTNYFFCGLFRNHYGPIRNQAAFAIMRETLDF